MAAKKPNVKAPKHLCPWTNKPLVLSSKDGGFTVSSPGVFTVLKTFPTEEEAWKWADTRPSDPVPVEDRGTTCPFTGRPLVFITRDNLIGDTHGYEATVKSPHGYVMLPVFFIQPVFRNIVKMDSRMSGRKWQEYVLSFRNGSTKQLPPGVVKAEVGRDPVDKALGLSGKDDELDDATEDVNAKGAREVAEEIIDTEMDKKQGPKATIIVPEF